PSDKAVSSMLEFMTEKWGVPSAPHQMGQELFGSLQECYKGIYSLLNAKEEDTFVLTSSGQESVTQVFMAAYYDITDPTGRNQYIVSSIDEAASLMSLA